MNIVHITAECYPAAKAGGLADVAGSLPQYLNKRGFRCEVIIPFYQNSWLKQAVTELVYEGKAPFGADSFYFQICRLRQPKLNFELYLVKIPGRFDRPGIYLDPFSGHPYWDEMERFISFQIAALEWLNHLDQVPDIIHCHDHHTALVPFMMSQSFRYQKFGNTPSVLTIHNGEYQGRYDWKSYTLLPAFNLQNAGLLDWEGELNSLAAGIKCAWRVTTVSKGYLGELMESFHGLEKLLRHERAKTAGILNGIDTEIWNPFADPYLDENYPVGDVQQGKMKNKKQLCKKFGLDPDKPLFAFIGRLVFEKGADLLPGLIKLCCNSKREGSFLILGTGDPALHKAIEELDGEYTGCFASRLEYNEKLAHRIYAGSDFLLMPSRVEPCGLNQLYAMRYGTLPVVRNTGGLADTVADIDREGGYGIVFETPDINAAAEAVDRAVELFRNQKLLNTLGERVMDLDFSWGQSADQYKSLYIHLKTLQNE